jgi:Secretion system C-terminal sorting domain
MKRITYFIFIICYSIGLHAQLAPCQNGLVYWNLSPIRIYDPSLPYNGLNPVNSTVPNGAGGLSYGPNLNGGPSPTYYTVIGAVYHYWNGISYVSTGHAASPSAVNLGHGPGCLYNLVGGSGNVYKYIGTGPDFLLVTVPGWGGGGPYDVVVDNCCNFYLLRTLAPQALWCFDPNGVLTNSCSLSNLPSSSAGGGFAIVGNQVVVGNGGGLWVGNISGGNVNFTNITTTITAYNDFASCPIDCGGPCGVPLPISFGSFHGTKTINGNLLTWESEMENELSYFLVERSTDAQNFISLSKVNAKGQPAAYQFTDSDPIEGVLNYYKITAVDNTGKTSSTYVIHIKPSGSNNLAVSSLYPNPASDEFEVIVESQLASTAKLQVYNPAGILIRTIEKETVTGVTKLNVNINDIPEGLYLIYILGPSGEIVGIQKLNKKN